MKCRICGNASNNTIFNAKEMMFGYRDSFLYFQCSSCQCLQISNYPDNIQNYYRNNYYSFINLTLAHPLIRLKNYLIRIRDVYESEGRGLIGYLISRYKPNYHLRMLFLKINPYLQKNKKQTILDVGCGSGSFLKLLKILGYNNLTGLDPFIEKSITVDDTIEILKKNIYEIDKKFDLIFLNHSFEHMPNQRVAICSIASLLSENGVCIIRIPVSSSYAFKHYGVDWVQLDAPRHFYLHSIKSMEYLAKEANLIITEVHYDSTGFQFWGSEQYKNDITLTDKLSVSLQGRFFTKKQLKVFELASQKLNDDKDGDQVIIVLKKIAY